MKLIHTMVVGKFVSRVIQSLPSWEVTKYYGRVCWFQLQCLKYRIQTSKTWFNFKSKYMPGRLRSEAEYDEKRDAEKDKQVQSTRKMSERGKESSLANELLAKIPKSTFMKESLEKLRFYKKGKQKDSSPKQSVDDICTKSDKDTKKTNASKLKQRKQ